MSAYVSTAATFLIDCCVGLDGYNRAFASLPCSELGIILSMGSCIQFCPS